MCMFCVYGCYNAAKERIVCETCVLCFYKESSYKKRMRSGAFGLI